MWYVLYIRMWYGDVLKRFVKVENKHELFAIIGWLHSTVDEHIDRIDYTKIAEIDEEKEFDNIINYPKYKYTKES